MDGIHGKSPIEVALHAKDLGYTIQFQMRKHAQEAGISSMSGRPSRVRQREIQQIVRGAIKAGAKVVTIRVGEAEVDISLSTPEEQKTVAPEEQIRL